MVMNENSIGSFGRRRASAAQKARGYIWLFKQEKMFVCVWRYVAAYCLLIGKHFWVQCNKDQHSAQGSTSVTTRSHLKINLRSFTPAATPRGERKCTRSRHNNASDFTASLFFSPLLIFIAGKPFMELPLNAATSNKFTGDRWIRVGGCEWDANESVWGIKKRR